MCVIEKGIARFLGFMVLCVGVMCRLVDVIGKEMPRVSGFMVLYVGFFYIIGKEILCFYVIVFTP